MPRKTTNTDILTTLKEALMAIDFCCNKYKCTVQRFILFSFSSKKKTFVCLTKYEGY